MSSKNFNEKIEQILARRAAYRCSLPMCRKLTVGPGLKDDDVEITGRAVHIYSPSEAGLSDQGALTPAQFRALSNAIWVCSDHSDLIDKATGDRYPLPIIKSWKALHEFRTAYKQSGRTSVFGFVRTLHILESELFAAGTEIELAKTTFLVGANGTGKAALCEWLAAVDTPRHLLRWLDAAPLRFRIFFEAPIEHELSVSAGAGNVTTKLDSSYVAIKPYRFTVAFLQSRCDRQYEDDLDLLSNTLNLDRISTRSLAAFIDADALSITAGKFRKEPDDNGDLRERLYCTLKTGSEMSFTELSGGEQGRVILDFAIARMRNVAEFAPGLLIIEWPNLSVGAIPKSW